MCRFSLRPYQNMDSRSPRDENIIPRDFNGLHADSDERFDGGIGRGREALLLSWQ